MPRVAIFAKLLQVLQGPLKHVGLEDSTPHIISGRLAARGTIMNSISSVNTPEALAPQSMHTKLGSC